jgi:hypothetical protein
VPVFENTCDLTATRNRDPNGCTLDAPCQDLPPEFCKSFPDLPKFIFALISIAYSRTGPPLAHLSGTLVHEMPKNTGPNTFTGKLNSSQNSTDHGMCQVRFLLLPGESKEAFDRLRKTYLTQYDIDEPCVPDLVETLTERDWLQQRCVLRICKLEAQLAEAEAGGNDELIDKVEKRLLSAQRYKTAAENSFKRALQMLERFRHIRIVEQQAARRNEIYEFSASERALVARDKQDIEIDTQMEVPAIPNEPGSKTTIPSERR